MLVGMLFTAGVCFIVFIISLGTCYYAFKKTGVNPLISKAYGLTMLGMGTLYVGGGLPALLTSLNKITTLENFYLALVVLAPLVGVFTIFFFVYKLTYNKKWSYLVSGVYCIFFLYFIYHTLTQGGVHLLEKTYFTYDFTLEPSTRLFLFFLILPLVIFSVFDFFKSGIKYTKTRTYKHKIYFFYTTSFVITYLPSALIPLGIMQGWFLSLACVIMTFAILLGFYTAYLKEQN